MARQWGLLLALALGGLVSGRGLAAAPRLALRVPPCEARRTQRGMRDCAALPLRGGGGGGEEVAAEREDVKNVEPWDMEQSPKIAAILADPDKRDLAYNATVRLHTYGCVCVCVRSSARSTTVRRESGLCAELPVSRSWNSTESATGAAMS